MKNIIIGILALIIIVGGIWYAMRPSTNTEEIQADPETAQTVDPLTAESQELVGLWQSTTDSQAQIVFAEDGTTTDLYSGTQLSSGVWSLYTDDSAEYNPSGIFLRSVLNGETYEYAIVELTDEKLVLSYLERGNILEYQRISE